MTDDGSHCPHTAYENSQTPSMFGVKVENIPFGSGASITPQWQWYHL